MTQLEKISEEWARTDAARCDEEGEYIRIKSAKMCHLVGMQAGIRLAIETIDDIACGLTPAQKEGWSAARSVVEDLLKEKKP